MKLRSQSTAVRQLPLEISDAIIDYFDNDRESLYACSLTCKKWIPRSRSHIFSNVSLDNFDGTWAGSGGIKRTLPKFLHAIQSPSQPGRYVRSLTLRFRVNGFQVIGPFDFSWVHEPPALTILAENLPEVRELQLNNMSWAMLDTAGRTAILSGFETVRDFALNRGKFSRFTEIPELISSFPALESLCCNGNYFTSKPGNPLGPAHLELSPLHKLQIGGNRMSQIMAWFTSGAYKCDISNVEVTVTAAQELMDVFEFLKALGPTLKDLHLTVQFYQSPWDIDAMAVDLTHNTSLVSLRISHRFYATKQITTAYLRHLDYIPRLLSQIRSSKLESLLIDLQMNPWIKDKILDAPTWSDIERTLSHPRFLHLQNLTFNHSSKISVENLRNMVEKMPDLAAREILHFEGGDP